MNFDFKSISSNRSAPVYLIAEVGVNHNGNLGLAKSMVRSAAECGAHAVKFQTFTAEGLVTRGTPKVEYQKSTTSDQESHYEMIKNLEMPESFYPELIELCNELKVDFLSTPYDVQSVDFLESLNVGLYKAASADLVDHILLERIAKTLKPTILSTGMATLGEIEEALEIFHKQGNEQVILLHCVSNYPSQYEEMNLACMASLRQRFELPVGLSDHTLDNMSAVVAASLGAVMIEKHFTLDRKMPGVDQSISMQPEDLRELKSDILNVRKILGDNEKIIQKSEISVKQSARRSLVARVDIPLGTPLQPEMLACKRPGTGISPGELGRVLGKPAKVALSAEQVITWEMF